MNLETLKANEKDIVTISCAEFKENLEALVGALGAAKNDISIAHSVACHLLDSLGDTEEGALSELVTYLSGAHDRAGLACINSSFAFSSLNSNQLEIKA